MHVHLCIVFLNLRVTVNLHFSKILCFQKFYNFEVIASHWVKTPGSSSFVTEISLCSYSLTVAPSVAWHEDKTKRRRITGTTSIQIWKLTHTDRERTKPECNLMDVWVMRKMLLVCEIFYELLYPAPTTRQLQLYPLINIFSSFSRRWMKASFMPFSSLSHYHRGERRYLRRKWYACAINLLT